jgi:TldD protein
LRRGFGINLLKHLKNADGYTELRNQEVKLAVVKLVNGFVNENRQGRVIGSCARAFRGGKWGFASSPYSDSDNLGLLVLNACRNASEVSFCSPGELGCLPEYPGSVAFCSAPVLTAEEALDFLPFIDSEISSRFKGITSRTLLFSGVGERVQFASSDNAVRETSIDRASLFISFTVAKGTESFKLFKKFYAPQLIEAFRTAPELLLTELEKLYEELVLKSEGVMASPGVHDCILGSGLTGILAHEAIGHTVESDLVRAGSIAGDYLGQQVASSLVTLVDCASECLGEPCPVPVFMDEEGIKAQNAVLIENGVLKSFLHNRESAALYGVEPAGNGRAGHFNQEPSVRMRNTAIMPGGDRLEDMIASIQRGYYLMDYQNGQADMTGEFMFSVNRGYEIVNGKLGRAIHDTVVSGMAFDMLKTVSAVSDNMQWSNAGCGKKYGIAVGMGGPDVKCRIRIGG